MALAMSDEEILVSYRTAKVPAAQINVLAELNGLHGKEGRQKIVEALERAGLAKEELPKERGSLDVDAAMALYEQGLTDMEIAERQGVHHTTVNTWRRKNNLPQNKRPGPREVREEPEQVAQEAAVPDAAPPFFDEGIIRDMEILLDMAVRAGGQDELELVRRLMETKAVAYIEARVSTARYWCELGEDS